MNKKKIAFVVARYGDSIDGGAEAHCKMLANHLSSYYDIEVITTCIKNYSTGVNEYEQGVSYEDGILTRRFYAQPKYLAVRKKNHNKIKLSRKIRRFFFRIGILKYLTYIKPIWNLNIKNEINYMKSNFFYTPTLVSYLEEKKDNYAAFIFITYAYPLAVFGIKKVSNKAIFIPTAHNENLLFLSIYTHIFNNVKHIAFNTTSEQKLCENIFGKAIADNSVIGVGIEISPPDTWNKVKNKYNIPDEYILYLGRVDIGKIGNLIEMFQSFKKRNPSKIKLVLTGGIHTIIVNDDDIIYTGFVSDAEKTAIIQNCILLINPSKYESLSLILLEAMWHGKPLLVNGNCKVLLEHCIKSNGAAMYYKNKNDFMKKLNKIITSKELQETMKQKGKIYVSENYNWESITNKFRTIIESF